MKNMLHELFFNQLCVKSEREVYFPIVFIFIGFLGSNTP